jgi:hypothetical protein
MSVIHTRNPEVFLSHFKMTKPVIERSKVKGDCVFEVIENEGAFAVTEFDKDEKGLDGFISAMICRDRQQALDSFHMKTATR